MTDQISEWTGSFGEEYTDRNALSPAELEGLYRSNYGVTRTELNRTFLEGMSRETSFLEVGSNVGNQLVCLREMGFSRLFGIEVQAYAVRISKARTRVIEIIRGSAFDLPFPDGSFDVVFTSGVLIHIHPDDLERVMREVHRCAGKHIWGFEYFAERQTNIPYHGRENLLWKDDFAGRYLDLFADLRKVREQRLKYRQNENVDSMFLLQKV